jgi:hypothetical protein
MSDMMGACTRNQYNRELPRFQNILHNKKVGEKTEPNDIPIVEETVLDLLHYKFWLQTGYIGQTYLEKNLIVQYNISPFYNENIMVYILNIEY